MQTLKAVLLKILAWTSGKKTAILAIIAMAITWGVKENAVDLPTAEFVLGVLGVLGGTVSYATKKLVFEDKEAA